MAANKGGVLQYSNTLPTDKYLCETWGFHGREDSNHGLLGCDAM